jgi:hypothetical protein
MSVSRVPTFFIGASDRSLIPPVRNKYEVSQLKINRLVELCSAHTDAISSIFPRVPVCSSVESVQSFTPGSEMRQKDQREMMMHEFARKRT